MISEQKARDAADQREAGEYGTVISAKQARDKQAFAEFRAIDQQRYERQLREAVKANLKAAQDGVRDAGEHVCSAIRGPPWKRSGTRKTGSWRPTRTPGP